MISPGHALTDRERDFCRIYVAQGKKNAADAYRRTFLFQRSDEAWVELDARGRSLDGYEAIDEYSIGLQAWDATTVQKRVATLLKRDTIQAYLDYLEASPSQKARWALADSVALTTGKEQVAAAEKILGREDKMGVDDATRRFWQITSEEGADVVVPLPVDCPHCGEKLEVTFPARDMFGGANG